MILRNITEALSKIEEGAISLDQEVRVNLFELGELKVFLSAFKEVPENIEREAEAWLVLQGQALLCVGKEEFRLRKGDLIKIESGEKHSWRSDKGVVLLGFDPNP